MVNEAGRELAPEPSSKTELAERVLDTSAGQLSNDESDGVGRLRRLSGLFDLPVRGAEGDAEHER